MATKRALGRGLKALINEQPTREDKQAEQDSGIQTVPVEKIRKNRLQPRQTFDPTTLAELAESIRARGVLQPLLVRATKSGYELIAGERRLRASGQAGLTEVPVIVTDARGSETMELALIENVQREDLNVLEEAQAYQLLAEKFDLTQEQIANRVGKARASVANALRLLSLAPEVRQLVLEGSLSAGHAKLLAGISSPGEQVTLAQDVAREGLSVRALEKRLSKTERPPKKSRTPRPDIPRDHLKHLSDKLHAHFGTSVSLSPCKTHANGKKAKGFIQIDFYSNEELDRILDLVGLSSD